MVEVFFSTSLCCLWLIVGLSSGDLTVVPRGRALFIGERVVLKCGTDHAGVPVEWTHWSMDDTRPPNYIFSGGLVQPSATGHRQRYQVTSVDSPTGACPTCRRFDLVIDTVEVADAGRYTCHDDDGAGDQSATAHLVVIESSDIACQSNITASTSMIEGDLASVTCSVNYVGRAVPVGVVRYVDVGVPLVVVGLSDRVGHAGPGSLQVSVAVAARAGSDGVTGVCVGECRCNLRRLSDRHKFNRTTIEHPGDARGADVDDPDNVDDSRTLVDCAPTADVLRPVRNVRIERVHDSRNGPIRLRCLADVGSPPIHYRWTSYVVVSSTSDPNPDDPVPHRRLRENVGLGPELVLHRERRSTTDDSDSPSVAIAADVVEVIWCIATNVIGGVVNVANASTTVDQIIAADDGDELDGEYRATLLAAIVHDEAATSVPSAVSPWSWTTSKSGLMQVTLTGVCIVAFIVAVVAIGTRATVALLRRRRSRCGRRHRDVGSSVRRAPPVRRAATQRLQPWDDDDDDAGSAAEDCGATQSAVTPITIVLYENGFRALKPTESAYGRLSGIERSRPAFYDKLNTVIAY